MKNKSHINPAQLGDMPPEILMEIFWNLDINSLLDLRQSNKNFKRVIDDPYFLTGVLQRHTSEPNIWFVMDQNSTEDEPKSSEQLLQAVIRLNNTYQNISEQLINQESVSPYADYFSMLTETLDDDSSKLLNQDVEQSHFWREVLTHLTNNPEPWIDSHLSSSNEPEKAAALKLINTLRRHVRFLETRNVLYKNDSILPDTLQNDTTFLSHVIKRIPIYDISNIPLTKSLAHLAVDRSSKAYLYITPPLNNDLLLLKKAISKSNDPIEIYKSAPYQLKQNESVQFLLGQRLGQLKKYPTERMRFQPEYSEYVVHEGMLSEWGMGLENISLAGNNLVKIAVQQNGMALQFAKTPCRDKEIALLAVTNNWQANQFLSWELKKDPDITLEIIKQNPEYIAERYWNPNAVIPTRVMAFVAVSKASSPKVIEVASRAFNNAPQLSKQEIKILSSITNGQDRQLAFGELIEKKYRQHLINTCHFDKRLKALEKQIKGLSRQLFFKHTHLINQNSLLLESLKSLKQDYLRLDITPHELIDSCQQLLADTRESVGRKYRDKSEHIYANFDKTLSDMSQRIQSLPSDEIRQFNRLKNDLNRIQNDIETSPDELDPPGPSRP